MTSRRKERNMYTQIIGLDNFNKQFQFIPDNIRSRSIHVEEVSFHGWRGIREPRPAHYRRVNASSRRFFCSRNHENEPVTLVSFFFPSPLLLDGPFRGPDAQFNSPHSLRNYNQRNGVPRASSRLVLPLAPPLFSSFLFSSFFFPLSFSLPAKHYCLDCRPLIAHVGGGSRAEWKLNVGGVSFDFSIFVFTIISYFLNIHIRVLLSQFVVLSYWFEESVM